MSILLSEATESLITSSSPTSEEFLGAEPLFSLTHDTHEEEDDEGGLTWKEWLHWYYLYTNNWFECNAFCVTFLVLDLAGIGTHYWMMVAALHGWAGGNVALLVFTFLSVFMSFFSGSLLVGNPITMMAPKWVRQTFFLFALAQVITFNAQLVSLAYKYFKGLMFKESFSEVVGLYLLLVQVCNYVPSLFLFLFDGLAFSEFALFNKNYGDWSDVDIPGLDEFIDKYSD